MILSDEIGFPVVTSTAPERRAGARTGRAAVWKTESFMVAASRRRLAVFASCRHRRIAAQGRQARCAAYRTSKKAALRFARLPRAARAAMAPWTSWGLDSGCVTTTVVATTSMRGPRAADAQRRSPEGVHSGDASGIVLAFRIAPPSSTGSRTAATRPCAARGFPRAIPEEACARTAQRRHGERDTQVPFADRRSRYRRFTRRRCVNRTWRLALGVTGADGFPACKRRQRAAANLPPQALSRDCLRQSTGPGHAGDARCSIRSAHGAPCAFEGDEGATGWNAPPTAPWRGAGDRRKPRMRSMASHRPPWARAAPFRSWRARHISRKPIRSQVLGPKSKRTVPNEFWQFLPIEADGGLAAGSRHAARTAPDAMGFQDCGVGGPASATVVLSACERRIGGARVSASKAGRGGVSRAARVRLRLRGPSQHHRIRHVSALRRAVPVGMAAGTAKASANGEERREPAEALVMRRRIRPNTAPAHRLTCGQEGPNRLSALMIVPARA